MKAARSKAGYFELNDNPDIDARISINSSSPILPTSELSDFDNETAAKPGTFHTEGLESFYKPIDGYEEAHRYDSEYAWSVADEGRVVRKVCCPHLCCSYDAVLILY